MVDNGDSYKSKLRDHGYKLTTQRLAILDAIEEHEGKHLNPEEIYEIVKKAYPDIGLATVYRTLLLLERLELVYKHDFDDGCSRYEMNRSDENHGHHHLICTKCGTVDEVEGDLLESAEHQILKNNRFLVRDHRVKFYGLCENCLNKQNKEI